MRVRVLFFALYRDLAGTDGFDLELPAGATVSTLLGAVRGRGRLDRMPPDPAVAVNQTYATRDHPLAEGDEIALLPPVAGG